MATACHLTSNNDVENEGRDEEPNETERMQMQWQVESVGLKGLRKRCKSFFVQGKKKEAKLGKSADIGVRDRRSRLAEDALFYDDMLEVAHLHGHVLERPDQTTSLSRSPPSLGARAKFSFSSEGISPSTGCVCLKYTRNISKDLEENSRFSETTRERASMGARLKEKFSNALSSTSSSTVARLARSIRSSENGEPKRRSRKLKRGDVLNVLDSLERSSPVLSSKFGSHLLVNVNHLSLVSLNSGSTGRSQSVTVHGVEAASSMAFSISTHFAHNVRNKVAVHSQIDFSNFLIPGQKEIVNCPFYWGKIDRYEAEKLLSDKPEGSFLLRDSAQDDFLFSVSFRRYSRSLHARIEEYNHLFSFDCHDPGVHATASVRKLLDHYKDPMSCMFFEPMLLSPVMRKCCFSLQSLVRGTICDSTTYSGVLQLPIPKVLKQYLREYHYKHKVCIRCFEETA